MERTPEDEVGRELREERPAPSQELVMSIARSVRAGRRPSLASRLVVALVLSLGAAVALGATGGMAQVTDAPKSVVKLVKKAVADKPAKQQKKTNRVTNSPAQNQYGEKPKCNSGRGNGSEGKNSQLIDPHSGGTGVGPGTYPTVDCDPGNSGDQNRGGD
ncbi:MAG: hypothetical protein H0V20_05010 [Actinobacteria bacterium]|nr:hypothetical protein [Actinomycetota bacterium]